MLRVVPALPAVLVLLVASLPVQAESPPARATSLLGTPLAPPSLASGERARLEAELEEALAAWARNPDDADALIWAGRRTAYLGRFAEAIEIFSEGIARHPGDPRLYRHRGHRYLTVRQIDRAIADLEKAAELIAGSPDEVEPDGLPNDRNLPTSTLHSNVFYHLALGLYLKGEFVRAAERWEQAKRAVANGDNLVSASHWLYLSLRRSGQDAAAASVLVPITPGLEVIENGEYHDLLLMYKGERTPDALLAKAGDDAGGSALRYGVGAWLLVSGRRREAVALWESIVSGSDWPSFGHLAAEAELARLRGVIVPRARAAARVPPAGAEAPRR